MISNSFFVIIEGIDGSGKTTQVKLISELGASLGYKVIKTREPRGSLRDRINALDPSSPNLAEQELQLFLEDRELHYESVIIPALNTGTFIVCDRGPMSTYGYQYYGRNLLDKKFLESIRAGNIRATQGVAPDLTLLLDLPVPIARKRKKKAADKNRLDKESPQFYNRVRFGYLEEAQRSGNVVVIDANHGKEIVFRSVRKAIMQRLEERGQRPLQACS